MRMSEIKKSVSYIIKFCSANLNFNKLYFNILFLRRIDEDNDGR